ncbi:hypothetical protein TEA_002400 [Camellia sinensis var. sinensis]|uniref:Uncharacterized protein n=1 Tax=Camellia sinensis var. sinensis TaxID=542762 RepID=A0A4S4D3G8_CAMSN|nr:hypothetical protein TEA_002400 [Camellia sinensis var. sinensis]
MSRVVELSPYLVCFLFVEIAWQRLDEIQPASEDVISRGTTGLKLYMVAHFLVSLKAWILAHKPPATPKSNLPLKGLSFPFLLNGNADTFCFLIILEFRLCLAVEPYPRGATWHVDNFEFNFLREELGLGRNRYHNLDLSLADAFVF